jgi:hypothetical protein
MYDCFGVGQRSQAHSAASCTGGMAVHVSYLFLHCTTWRVVMRFYSSSVRCSGWLHGNKCAARATFTEPAAAVCFEDSTCRRYV